MIETSTIVRSGVRRPKWVNSRTKQYVVFVRDCSGSMAGQKAQDVSAAGQDLVSELALPVNKDGFSVAVVDFAVEARVAQALERATVLDGRIPALNAAGSTNVAAGLEAALAVLDGAGQTATGEYQYLRPVVICYTDGCHNTGSQPGPVAERLKAKADLVTVAFGSDADESLLKQLATSEQHFYRCNNGRELRAFLAAVGATITMTLAAGQNATQALSAVQQ
jgi:uncharacterized protein YegL